MMTIKTLSKRLFTHKLAAKPILLAMCVILASCSWIPGASIPSGSAAIGPLATVDPNATSTPTPFIPLPPTLTPTALPTSTQTPIPTPTSVNPWGDFPAPVESSAIEIPRPMPRIDFPEGVVNIVLLGSDYRPDRSGSRSDTFIILSLDPGAGTATMISIPRDFYVYLPGWRVDRINTADPRGGPEMVKNAILYNTGIEIDHWVRVYFSGFVAAVDLLGGIYVNVGSYLKDQCGSTIYTYSPGMYQMDGYTALCYVRMRKNSSDFDRLRRQQEVVKALFTRILNLDGLSRVPQLYDQFDSLMQTDMELGDILPLVPLAATLASDSSRLHTYSIDANMVTMWRVPYSGASVLLPNWDKIKAMLQDAFGP